MRYLNSHDFGKIIQEAISKTINEDGLPKPSANAPKPSMGVPKPSANAPKPSAGVPMPSVTAPKPTGIAPSPSAGAPVPSGNVPTPSAPVDDDNLDLDSGLDSILGDDEDDTGIDVEQVCENNDIPDNGKTDNGYCPKPVFVRYDNYYEKNPDWQNKSVLKIWVNYMLNLTAVRFCNAINADSRFKDVANFEMLRSGKEYLAYASNNPSGFNCGILLISVAADKVDEFKKLIPVVVDTLWGIVRNPKMQYDPAKKDDFASALATLASIPTEQEKAQVQMKIADSAMELLANLKDPAIRQKIASIGGIILDSANEALFGDNGFKAGHALSYDNKMEVWAQDQNATFVEQDWIWEKFYNHEIVDPNDFILIKRPSWKSYTKDDKDKGARACGFKGGYEEFKKRSRRGELSNHEKHAVRMAIQRVSTSSTFFYYIKVYDVANTRVIPGKVSKFFPGPDQERGLSNNATKLAMANDAARHGGYVFNQQDTTPAAAPAKNNNDQLSIIRDSLFAIISSKLPTLPTRTNDPSVDLTNAAYEYAEKKLLPIAGGAISVDETKKLFCKGFAAAVTYSCGGEDSIAANYLSAALASRGKDSTLSTLVGKWFNEWRNLMKAVYKDVKKKIESLNATKSASAPQTTSIVAEEGLNSEGVEMPQFNVLSQEQFGEILAGAVASEGGNYEVQNDTVAQETLQESFFVFLDKMERIW